MADKELMNFLKEQFGNIEQRFIGIDQRFDGIDQKFIEVDQRFTEMDQRFNGLEDTFNNRFDTLEKSQQEDIIAVLTSIDQKTSHIPSDIEYLRNITSRHDMEIERLKKQVKN